MKWPPCLQSRGLAYTIVNYRVQARHIQELEATMRSIVYVGMDFHKETIAIAVSRDSARNVEFERTIRNEPGKIKKFFNKLKEKGESILSATKQNQPGLPSTEYFFSIL